LPSGFCPKITRRSLGALPKRATVNIYVAGRQAEGTELRAEIIAYAATIEETIELLRRRL
jgi:hypothetical protein